MTDPDELFDSARRLMVQVVCPECDRPVGVVRDSRHGPLLLLEDPDGGLTGDPLTMLRLLKLARTYTYGDRVLHPREGDRVPFPVARRVRRLEPNGVVATDWTAQRLVCQWHGSLEASRWDIQAAVRRFRRRAKVIRVEARPSRTTRGNLERN